MTDTTCLENAPSPEQSRAISAEKNRRLWHVFFVLAALFFVASRPAVAAAGKLDVAASILPLADFAREVGGEKVSVTMLLPPGASPHTYEPTPRTMRELSRAKIFVKVGAGFEFWANRLVSAANPRIITVDSSKGVDLIRMDDGHDHGEPHGVDPHIWLDPLICIEIVTKIEKAFSESDPAHAASYKRNADAYREKLRVLDKEIEEKIRVFKTKKFVAFHAAWNYFARRYGLHVAGVIEESPGKEPTPKHVGRILDELKRMKVGVVFAEPQFSPKIAEAIAREAGGKVLILDPVGGQKGRETYLSLMRYNLSVMEEAMK